MCSELRTIRRCDLRQSLRTGLNFSVGGTPAVNRCRVFSNAHNDASLIFDRVWWVWRYWRVILAGAFRSHRWRRTFRHEMGSSDHLIPLQSLRRRVVEGECAGLVLTAWCRRRREEAGYRKFWLRRENGPGQGPSARESGVELQSNRQFASEDACASDEVDSRLARVLLCSWSRKAGFPMLARVPKGFEISAKDCLATFDYRNCPFETGRSVVPLEVGDVAPVPATRVPVPGQQPSVANGRFGEVKKIKKARVSCQTPNRSWRSDLSLLG